MTIKLYRFEHETKNLYQDNTDFLSMHNMMHNDNEHYPAIYILKMIYEKTNCFPYTFKYWKQKHFDLILSNKTNAEIDKIINNDNYKDMYVEYKTFVNNFKSYFSNVLHFFNSKKAILKWFKMYQIMAIFDDDFKLYEYEFEIDFNLEYFQMVDDIQTMIDLSKIDYIKKTEIRIGDL